MLAKRIFLLLVFSLPFMKPAVHYPVVLADLLFLLFAAAYGIDLLRGRARLKWRRHWWVLGVYLFALACSVAASLDPRISAFKMATELYLVGLAAGADLMVEDERDLKRFLLAWLAASAIVALLDVAALAAFPFAPHSALVRYNSFGFGSLPPGSYPRFSATFLNANMMCDYLTVSLLLLVVAIERAWLPRRLGVALLGATVIAALTTISPGLGGVGLAAGLWIWAKRGQVPRWIARLGLTGGLAIATAFILITAFMPIVHSTAPFLIHVPLLDVTLAPTGRVLTWSAAFREFAAHPLLGHGIGVDAVHVYFESPSGGQHLTDAHNSFLNIAAQCGLVGLAGELLLVWWVFRQSPPWLVTGPNLGMIRLALGLGFLDAFAYQGLSGSFEDARYLWLLLGLFMAAVRLGRAAEADPVPAR